MTKIIAYLKKQKNILLLVYITFLLILPNCARYKAQKLTPPQAPIHEKDNLVVAKKTLTEDEAKKIFGGRKIIERGYTPVQIYIKNKTDKTYYLNPNDIQAPLEASSNVARKLHRSVGWKTAKYFVIGGPIWATIEGLSSYEANKTINTDFREKTVRLDEAIKIRPYGIINKVMFIPNESYVSDNLKITLTSPELKKRVMFDL